MSNFLDRKFSTAKRFGCEGLDSAISGLGKLVQRALKHKVREVTFGMAHRGRLNTLCCVVKKPYAHVLKEFEGEQKIFDEKDPNYVHGFSDDVKYHQGASNVFQDSEGNSILVNLLPNPSHLEAVNPVVQGSVKSRQVKLRDEEQEKVLPVIIHGDAALSGQGVVYETQQLEDVEGWGVGGMVHIVFNNQIGFTTDSVQCRSGYYCTNIAKMNDNFVIHVNADEPELVDHAVQLAVDYRMKFKSDVYVDIVGYRKFGHNEQDQPSFTQPLMYQKIKKTLPMYLKYKSQLLKEGVISEADFQKTEEKYQKMLSSSLEESKTIDCSPEQLDFYSFNTLVQKTKGTSSIDSEMFEKVGRQINTLPEKEFKFHGVLRRLYKARLRSIEEGEDIDWGTAEALAYASLLAEGHGVRLTGEDVERGTFSHRHAALVD